jgi:hypothetical protein
MQLTVSNFSSLITIHNTFVFVDSDCSISVAIQNQTILKMTDNISSQNLIFPPKSPCIITYRNTNTMFHRDNSVNFMFNRLRQFKKSYILHNITSH